MAYRFGDEVTPLERAGYLAHARGRAFQRRVAEALEICQKGLELIGPHYIACSWGKDSLVMLHLAQQIKPDVAVWHLADEHEDLLDNYTEVEQIYKSQFGLPDYTRVIFGGDSVPENLERSKVWLDYPVAFVGLRAEEHRYRRLVLKKYGPIHQYLSSAREGTWRIAPVAWWSWRDIWAYIVLHNLPYLSSYDQELAGSHAVSRTSVHVPLERAGGPKGMTMGRIAAIRERSPEYYAMIAQICPEVASVA